jgi:hypothetical protein
MKPSQAIPAIEHLIGKRRPAFIWGAPGVGKSDVVRQIGARRNLEVRDIRLSLLDPTDIKGFPVPDVRKRVMNWLPANFIPTEGQGILFFDELNAAAPAVQAAGYQFILDRRIGDVQLPAGWSILAAGNRSSDRALTHTMPSPLANRFVHIDFETDIDDWYAWALEHGISAQTCAFLRFRPALLHSFDAKTNPRSFPSPRSWVFADEIRGSALDADTEFELVCGAVGEGAATEYLAFVRLAASLPSVDQILLDPDSVEIDKTKPEIMFALVTSLDTQTTANNFERLMRFIGRLPPEFQVMYVRSVQRIPAIPKTQAYTAWCVKHAALLH